jgi:hypothetical protein
MPEQKPKQLSFDEFMAKHARVSSRRLMTSSRWTRHDQSPPRQWTLVLRPRSNRRSFSRRMDELRQWWLVRLLTAAGKENSPKAYRELFEYWLSRQAIGPACKTGNYFRFTCLNQPRIRVDSVFNCSAISDTDRPRACIRMASAFFSR